VDNSLRIEEDELGAREVTANASAWVLECRSRSSHTDYIELLSILLKDLLI